MRLTPWYFILLFALFPGSSETNNSEIDNDRETHYPYDSIRLPGNIIPLKYKLFLHPNVTHSFDYTGEVKILLEVKNQTSDIILHSLNISHYLINVYEANRFSDQTWDQLDYRAKVPVKITLKSLKLEQIMVRLENELSVAKRYVLVIHFGAPLRNGLRGFYRSSHVTPQGIRKYIATTHFEPTGARLAFPCFDEPAMKATFQISLVRQHGYTALSNMPSLESKTIDSSRGLIAEYFEESVQMSTYLVAFIVGEFSSLSSHTKRGVKVNVYVPDYQLAQVEYAREITPKILDYYEKFFQLDFPLPKIDLIGIPDFCLIAMENWGLVTYRLTGLLYDSQESSAAAKSDVARVIAHELAHQWFGNLVTMKWWDDLWLNEGFAAFVEYIGTDLVDHRWEKLEEFPVNNVQQSMSVDSHHQTHAVKVDVKNPADIGVLFDHSITYQKGSSVIRMMRDFMGAERFGKGLKNYLKRYQFSNAESDNLWKCLSEVTTYSVKEIMDTWIFNKGYPVITIYRRANETYLTQERFVTDMDLTNSTSSVSWQVPLTWRSQYDHKIQRKIFKGKVMKIDQPPGWWKLNADEYGFYRVNYNEDNWRSLAKQLKMDPSKLTSSDRANLIDDAFALAMAGRISEALAFNLMDYFTQERDWAPVEAASRSLAFINFIMYARPGPGYQLFQKYMLSQYMPLINLLGLKDIGSYHTKLMRTTVLKIAVQHNHPPTVSAAKEMYNQWMINGKKIPTDLREVVYLAGIKYGGVKEWNFMFEEWKNSKVPTEKVLLMYSLAATSDKTLLQKYLAMTLDDKIIKGQDACYLINKIAINPTGRSMSYNFLNDHWSEFIKIYGSGDHFRDLTQLFTGIFSTGKTDSDLEHAESFFKSHASEIAVAGGKLAADQAIADIKLNIAWLNRDEKTVVDWLKSKLGH